MSDAIFAPGFQENPYWWEAAPPLEALPALPDTAEVAIVGGGIAGLSTAIELGRHGVKALVIDRERIGWGASSRNGGALSGAGSLGKVRADLDEAFGKTFVAELAEEGEAAFEDFAALIEREALTCDFTRCGRFVGAHAAKAMEGLKRRAEMLNVATGAEEAWVVPKSAVGEEIATAKYHGGLVMVRAGGLHPAKYVRSLALAAERYGAVLASGVELKGYAREGDGGFVLETSRGRIKAKHLMLATNGYTGPATPWFRRRLIPVASYMIATEEIGEGRK
jgi:glycine/D-amino acid oxidase-like deaminating enzyme